MSKEIDHQEDIDLVRLRGFFEQQGVSNSELPDILAKARRRIRMLNVAPEKEERNEATTVDSLSRYLNLLSQGVPDLDAQKLVWPDLIIES